MSGGNNDIMSYKRTKLDRYCDDMSQCYYCPLDKKSRLTIDEVDMIIRRVKLLKTITSPPGTLNLCESIINKLQKQKENSKNK